MSYVVSSRCYKRVFAIYFKVSNKKSRIANATETCGIFSKSVHLSMETKREMVNSFSSNFGHRRYTFNMVMRFLQGRHNENKNLIPTIMYNQLRANIFVSIRETRKNWKFVNRKRTVQGIVARARKIHLQDNETSWRRKIVGLWTSNYASSFGIDDRQKLCTLFLE